jgi:hypothetical protein
VVGWFIVMGIWILLSYNHLDQKVTLTLLFFSLKTMGKNLYKKMSSLWEQRAFLSSRKGKESQAWWLIPVIPSMWEAEIRKNKP